MLPRSFLKLSASEPFAFLPAGANAEGGKDLVLLWSAPSRVGMAYCPGNRDAPHAGASPTKRPGAQEGAHSETLTSERRKAQGEQTPSFGWLRACIQLYTTARPGSKTTAR